MCKKEEKKAISVIYNSIGMKEQKKGVKKGRIKLKKPERKSKLMKKALVKNVKVKVFTHTTYKNVKNKSHKILSS